MRSGFRYAVKYVLPRMLLGPVFHFLHYCDTLKVSMCLLSYNAHLVGLERLVIVLCIWLLVVFNCYSVINFISPLNTER